MFNRVFTTMTLVLAMPLALTACPQEDKPTAEKPAVKKGKDEPAKPDKPEATKKQPDKPEQAKDGKDGEPGEAKAEGDAKAEAGDAKAEGKGDEKPADDKSPK